MSEDSFEALVAALQAFHQAHPDANGRLQSAYAQGHPLIRKLAEALRAAERSEAEMGEVLRRRHGLTMQEARVVACLVNGGTVKSCAGALGVAESTVRSHLKAVFWKTGVNRQTHLASLYDPDARADGEG